MKMLKSIAATLSILLLVGFIFYFMIYSAVNNTILSESFMINNMDKADFKSFAADYLVYRAKNLLPVELDIIGGIKINEFNKKLTDSFKGKWLETEMDTAVKGLYKYVVLKEQRLPTLDIKPLKAALTNTVTGELLKNSEVKTALTGIKGAAILLGGPYKSLVKNGIISNMFLDNILVNPQIKALGLDRKLLNEAILKYSEIKDVRTKTPGIDKEIVYGLVANYIDVDKAKDKLDLNVLMEKVYKNNDNPLTETRNLIVLFKKANIRILVVTVLCLLIIPILAFRKPTGMYRYMTAFMTLGGLAGLMTGIFGVYSKFIPSQVEGAVTSSNIGLETDNLNILKGLLESIFTGYFRNLIIQGIIFLITGIVLFVVLSKLVKTGKDGRSNAVVHGSASANSGLLQKHQALCLLGAYVLIAVIALNTYLSVASVVKGVGNTVGSSTTASGKAQPADFMGALSEAMGADFINYLVD